MSDTHHDAHGTAAHGHDDHGHAADRLGPIDGAMWAAGVLGVLFALLVVLASVMSAGSPLAF